MKKTEIKRDQKEILNYENCIDRFLCSPWFLLVLAIAYFSIPFWTHLKNLMAGDLLVSYDGITSNFVRMFYGESIRNLDIPLWNPYIAGGVPYGGTTSSGVFNPLMWFVALFSEVLQLYVFFGLQYAIGGIFIFLYLKQTNCSAVVSLASSVIYVFTVHMGGARKEHTELIMTAVYVPVILYLLERYLQERKLKWLFLGSGAMALQFLGGFLQYIIYSDIFVFFYLLYFGIQRKFPIKKMLQHGIAWVAAYFGMIAVSVIPLAHFMLQLSGSGASEMTYDAFVSYSLHPIKLLMSIFPYFFGEDTWSALLSVNASSGMDAELVMGAAAVSVILAGITLVRKNHYTRFMSLGALAMFAYSCLGNTVWLGKIIYHVPVLNLFRIPSRTLFLFTFCCIVLLAHSLNTLFQSKQHEKRLHIAHIAVGCVMLLAVMLYRTILTHWNLEALPFKRVFLQPFLLYGFYLLVFYAGWLFQKRNVIAKSAFRYGVAVVLVVVTLVQVWPFYQCTYYTKSEDVSFPEEIVENVDNYKVVDGSHTSFLRLNYAPTVRIQGLNSYTNFNLPALHQHLMDVDSAPMNYSGLYKDYIFMNSFIQEENDLLSMLGVKYIMLEPEVEASLDLITGCTEKDIIFTAESAELTASEGYAYAVWPIDVLPEEYYRVALNVKAEESGGQFYVDFYAEDYVSDYQIKMFTLQEGKNSYEVLIPTVGSTIPEDITFRIISLAGADLEILDVCVARVEPEWERTYEIYKTYEDFTVYENRKAKSLICAPKTVTTIAQEDKELLYIADERFDILNTSYIVNEETGDSFTNAGVEISNIQLTNNTVSADYIAEKDAFLNLSQSYYPGWNAYVDGEKREVYEVNGIIMGAFVPAGSHRVEFKYQPMPVYIGLMISCVTSALCVYFSRKEKIQKSLR